MVLFAKNLLRLFSYDFFDDFLIILDRVRYKYH